MAAGPAGVVPEVKSLHCPNCGAPVELRAVSQSVNAVCGYCQTILDTRTENLRVIQTFTSMKKWEPKIPLGSRGRIADGIFEVIGFQVRAINVEGTIYTWDEYLLFNPYKGYRYISEYNGHWNVIRTLRSLPAHAFKGNKKAAKIAEETFVHFQTAQARTDYVIGEFPWQVRVDETVTVEDYISPPKMLSAEITEAEIAWSVGEYTAGKDLWKAFNLSGEPPRPVGVFSNQPSPHGGRIRSVWTAFGLFLVIWFVLLSIAAGAANNDTVFQQRYSYSAMSGGEPSYVTRVFELKGRPSNVEAAIATDLSNQWAFFGFALINEETGQAFDFGEEVSYYFGTDSDGAWTEGNRSGSADVPSVPAGRYYLRVEPEMDKSSGRTVNYTITVKRDTPGVGWFMLAFFLLFIPPILVTWRVFKFENARWAESDYGSMFSSSSSSTDDSEDDDE